MQRANGTTVERNAFNILLHASRAHFNGYNSIYAVSQVLGSQLQIILTALVDSRLQIEENKAASIVLWTEAFDALTVSRLTYTVVRRVLKHVLKTNCTL